MNVLITKLKEVVASVLPITLIVVILNFTITPLETTDFIRFLIGALFVFIGLTIFLIGVDVGITAIGNHMGSALAKSNKVWLVVIAGLVLGFFISIAEPDLHILAEQVGIVTAGGISKSSIVINVSIGVGVMMAIGLLRIVFSIPLKITFTIFYGLIFILSLFSSSEFLAIAFDSSGATTGALTTPFMLALAVGISSMKKDSKSSESDSFGLVGISSMGAIIGVLIMGVLSDTKDLTGKTLISETHSTSVLKPFFYEIPKVAGEIFIALLPIIVIFIIFNFTSLHLSKKSFRNIMMGSFLTFVGLVIFLTGVNAGFMDAGRTIGYELSYFDNKAYVIIVGFILGLVTILAEPAVYVLTRQIEDVTSGHVQRKIVMVFLSFGVGLAVVLSIIRILVPGLQLWYFLLPGYIIALVLSHIVPDLFVGMAFDSGGVASGPMTATFILAFAQGAAEAIPGADVMMDGFGAIAMVAMTPIIALQILGFLYTMKSKKGRKKKNG